MDVGHHTAVGDGHSPEQLGELFIVPHCQLNMTWHYPCLLVVSGSVSSELQDLEEDNREKKTVSKYRSQNAPTENSKQAN